MNTQIKPVPKSRMVLCSADASPDSQRSQPDRAEHFFPGGHWVGAVRNASHELGVRFVILTTGYGLVNPDEVLEKYDKHIDQYRAYVTEKWRKTVPLLLGKGQYDLMLFYAGGCPRDKYLEVLKPILRSIGIALITFGQPNMCDVGKVRRVATMLINGTSLDKLRTILRYPAKLEYYSASYKKQRRLTPRAADSRYALEKLAGLARKGSGKRPGLPRPARAADAGRWALRLRLTHCNTASNILLCPQCYESDRIDSTSTAMT